jgi:hypothetical protein
LIATRKTITGALTAALLLGALPSAGFAQDVEDGFLPALATVASWSIEGIELTLADDSGTAVLTFEEPAVMVTETDVIALDGDLERLNTRNQQHASGHQVAQHRQVA